MNEPYKISFISLLVLIFLLPIFFVPSVLMPIGMAKTILLSVASIVAFLGFLYDTFRRGRIELPSALILWSTLAVPLVYLLSALFSATPGVSFFGYTFEAGTFAFVTMASALLFLSAISLRSRSRILKVYAAFFFSLSLIVIFAIVKITSVGSLLVFSTFAGNMTNPVGAWTDLAIILGLLVVLSLFAIEMLRASSFIKWFLYALFTCSLALLIVINFSLVWFLTLAGSIIILVYFTSVEKPIEVGEEKKEKHPNLWPAGILMAISILFIFNPTISSSGTISDTISNALQISNTDVRPSLMTTLDVSRSTLAHSPILGSGPNTFDKDWLLYKPQAINTTNFWNTVFSSGFGFLPSQIATTGILGTLVWIFFLLSFLMLLGKVLKRAPATRPERFLVVSSGLGALFLISAVFFYGPSMVVLIFGFIFVGVFTAAAHSTGVIGTRDLVLSKNNLTNFLSVLALIVLAVGTLAIGLVSFQKTLSVYHFENGLLLENTAGSKAIDIESELGKAISLAPSDVYFAALSSLELKQAQAILQSQTGTPEKNRIAFQNALQNSIAAAQEAVNANKGSYQNWVSLGSLYESLVPAPLSIPGAFESAQTAYGEAKKVNPLSPEIPLLLAKLELDNKNDAGARADIADALALKPDYADAYFFLAQLEAADQNIAKAIEAAKAGAVLSPGNAGIYFELGLLEYSNNDFSDAVIAFTQALSIAPDYANAKYFLGLSLEALGRHTEALSEFQDLLKSNPDNIDVQSVLANLRAGRAPFEKAAPAAAKPLKASNPPISSTTKK